MFTKTGLLTLLLFLQINFFIGSNGFFKYIKLYKKISEKKLEIFYLTERNIKLSIEIQLLNVNDELIEEYARNNLEMIKKNETFYRIIDSNSHYFNNLN
ncbi:MAG: septum formation initiator family protein [Buchnera aphidicola (Nurudea yanoniella)]